MAVILPGIMLAADMNGAMMYTSGPVTVNGSGVSRATTIFAGDRLQVPAQSAVTIAARGSSITVAPGSAVTFRGDAITLEPRSSVSVSTTEGMAVQVRRLTIAPAGKGETKFQVVRLNGNIVISAKLGAVEITDSSPNSNAATSKKKGGAVEEGKTATVPDPDAQTPPAAGTTTTTASTAASQLPGTIAGLASVGAAVGAAIYTTGTPISPTHP